MLKIKINALLLFGLLLMATLSTAQPWTEDYGIPSSTASFTATTGSTSFVTNSNGSGHNTWTRSGTGGSPKINLANGGISALGSNGEIQINASSSSSTAKFTPISSWPSSTTKFYFKTDIIFGNSTTTGTSGTGCSSGEFVLYIGRDTTSASTPVFTDGNSYTNGYSRIFVGLRFSYRSSGGSMKVEKRTGASGGSWDSLSNATSTTTAYIMEATKNKIEIYGNNATSGSITYTKSGSNTLTFGTYDIWVNDVKAFSGVAKSSLTAGTKINAISFMGENSVSNAAWLYMDDLIYNNDVAAANTPTVTITGTPGTFTSYFSDYSDVQSFTVTGTNLTGDAQVRAPLGFEVSKLLGSGYTTDSISFTPTTGTVSSTTFYVRAKNTSTSFPVSVSTNLIGRSAGSLRTNFAVTSLGLGSRKSSIAIDNSFTYSLNIDHATNRATAPFTNTTGNTAVMRFTLIDSTTDLDPVGTKMTAVTFSVNAAGMKMIKAAAIADVNTIVAASPTLDYVANTITFTGLTNSVFTVADQGTKVLSLRVSFKDTVIDNDQMQFSISSAVSDPAFSQFSFPRNWSTTSSITGDRNRIEVTADRIGIVKQTSGGAVNANIDPFIVAFINQYGSVDLDAASSTFTLTTTGTGMTSTSPYTITAGSRTVSDVKFSALQTGKTITATTTAFLSPNNTATTAVFDISGVAYRNGHFRTKTGATTWAATSSWEKLTAGVWGAVSSVPVGGSVCHIENNLSLGGAQACDTIFVKNGAKFTQDNNFTAKYLYRVLIGSTFETQNTMHNTTDVTTKFQVDSGATLIYNNSALVTSNSTFIPIEDYQSGSWVIVRNYSYGTSASNRILNESGAGTGVFNIQKNARNAFFGYLVFELPSGGSNNGNIVDGGSGASLINLCSNDLIVKNSNSTKNIILAPEAHAGITILGALRVQNSTSTNQFSFTSNTTGTPNVTINKGLIVTTGIVDMNQTSSSSGLMNLTIKDTLLVATNGNLTSTDPAGSTITLAGTDTQYISLNSSAGTTYQNIAYTINATSIAKTIGQNWQFGGTSSLTNNGTLHFGNVGSTALNLTEAGTATTTFTNSSTGRLIITSTAGLTKAATGNVGNVRLDTRSYHEQGTYEFRGTPQTTTYSTGDFITTGNISSASLNQAKFIINQASATSVVNLSSGIGAYSFNNPGGLDIRNGSFFETSTDYAKNGTTTNGNLIMTGGSYNIIRASTSFSDLLPRLSGGSLNRYLLSGGIVSIAPVSGAADNCYLRGARSYFNFVFNASDNNDILYHSSAVDSVKGGLSLGTGSTFDQRSFTFTGLGGLAMSGSALFRASLLNQTLPQLTGTYSLNSTSTLELYGSSATQTHSIRSISPLSYGNVTINSTGKNVTSGAANVVLGGEVIVAGSFLINNPASCMMNDNAYVSGAGSFNLRPYAMLKYGSANGIKTSGTGTSDGNIRVSGTRTLSKKAYYGFSGGVFMRTGNAIPDTVNALFVDKTNDTNTVFLTTPSVWVDSVYIFQKGLMDTRTGFIKLDSSGGFITETTNSYLIGEIRNSSFLPSTATNYSFGGLGVTLNRNTGGTNPGNVFVTRYTGDQAGVQVCKRLKTNKTFSSMKTRWKITPITNGGLKTNVTFTYNEAFLNGLSEANMNIYRKSDVGTLGYVSRENNDGRNTTSNTITLNNRDSFSNWTLGGSATPLPVELGNFDVKLNTPKSAILTWNTYSESNNSGFEIERSNDGIVFENLGFVIGKGTTLFNSNYSFIDNNLPINSLNSYYRLKQMDFNGNFEYSPMRKINFIQSNDKVSFQRNGNQILVSVPNIIQTYSIQMIDANGKVISMDNNIKSFDLNALQQGVYILRLQSNLGVESFKFIKE